VTPYESLRKSLKKQDKQRRKASSSTQLQKATAEVPRIARIVALEKAVAKKGLTDAERNNLGASLLREKLAAAAELADARAAERRAQMSAIGASMNSRSNDQRSQVHAPYTGDYVSHAPVRSETELPSQSRIAELEGELRKSTDPMERERIGHDLTFEKLRRAHTLGRI
jgi:hypothetical protein